MAGDLVGEGGRARKAPGEKCVTQQMRDRDEGRTAGGNVETLGNRAVKVKEVLAWSEIELGREERPEVETGQEGRGKREPGVKLQPRDNEAGCGWKVEQEPGARLLPLHLRLTWIQTFREFWRQSS